jgi:hypothetical protein
MTTIRAIRLASLVTAIDVLVASGFSIAAIIRLQDLAPAESPPTEASLLLAMYAATRTFPLAFALGAIYKQATPALLSLGAPAGAMQLLDAGIGLFEHDLGKCAGLLFYRRPPIPRGVSASQIRSDHAANQSRIEGDAIKHLARNSFFCPAMSNQAHCVPITYLTGR